MTTDLPLNAPRLLDIIRPFDCAMYYHTVTGILYLVDWRAPRGEEPVWRWEPNARRAT